MTNFQHYLILVLFLYWLPAIISTYFSFRLAEEFRTGNISLKFHWKELIFIFTPLVNLGTTLVFGALFYQCTKYK